MINQKIMVTGAAGTWGTALIELLIERGKQQVCALFHRECQLLALRQKYKKEAVSVELCDIRDGARLTSLAGGCDTIFHVAALKVKNGTQQRNYGQGKLGYNLFVQYLRKEEQFSMPFWASSMGEYAVVYLMEDPHRSQMNFTENGNISFDVSYEYPQISEDRTKRFRIYVTENNPVAVAKVYRSYVIEKGKFVTLEQKSQTVPEIQKLYEAPFIYLWGNFLISPSDIQWSAFRQSLDSPVMNHLLTFVETQENGTEFKNTLQQISNQDYVGSYQKNIICSYLSNVLMEENFWLPNVFPNKTAELLLPDYRPQLYTVSHPLQPQNKPQQWRHHSRCSRPPKY